MKYENVYKYVYKYESVKKIITWKISLNFQRRLLPSQPQCYRCNIDAIVIINYFRGSPCLVRVLNNPNITALYNGRTV